MRFQLITFTLAQIYKSSAYFFAQVLTKHNTSCSHPLSHRASIRYLCHTHFSDNFCGFRLRTSPATLSTRNVTSVKTYQRLIKVSLVWATSVVSASRRTRQHPPLLLLMLVDRKVWYDKTCQQFEEVLWCPPQDEAWQHPPHPLPQYVQRFCTWSNFCTPPL